jgi:site-specific DNA recombinase
MIGLPPPGSRFAVYARYSTSLQSFKSIEDQLTYCREYAKRLGWTEAGAFHDAERSGTTLIGRDGFFSMMAAADRGEFTIVLVEDLDRLSRTASSTHGILEELESLDITVCTVSSGVVTDMEVAFKATQNARYVKGLVEKTRRGLEGTVKAGRITGRLAYGYKKKFSPDGLNGERLIDEEEAVVIVRIYKDVANGVSLIALCHALNAEGVPGPKGKPWQPGALRGNWETGTGILRNKLYIGINEWGRTVVKHNRHKGTSKAKPTPVGERIVVEVPNMRIMDDDLFEAVQAVLAKGRKKRFYEQRQAEYLLSGLSYCGVCKGKYATLHDKLGCTTHALKGMCDNRRRVHRSDLEDAVLSGLKNRLLRPELIEPCLIEYRAEIARAMAEQEEKAKVGAVRLKELERQKSNILTHVREGKAQGLAAQALMEDLGAVEAERLRFEREAKFSPRAAPPKMDAETVVARLHALLDTLADALSGDERDAVRARDIIRSLVDRVVVTPLPTDHEDKRGIGPVRVTVEGPLATLLDLADQSRVVQHSSRPETMLDLATLKFSYYVDYIPQDVRMVPQGYADLAIISRLLDDAEGPVTKQEFVDALAKDDGGVPDYRDGGPLALRVKHAMVYLKDRREIRSIRWGPTSTGWVWEHIRLTDAEWMARAMNRPPKTHEPIPPIRITAPSAFVTVIGPKPPGT